MQSPNLQNIPIRDYLIAKLVRRAIIPSPGRRILEIDLSGAEVKTSRAYHKDPEMTRYLRDPKSDMHRDTAVELFLLTENQVRECKPARQAAKGNFVFAEFYGSWFIPCAKKLWKETREIKLADDRTLRQYLAAKGITELGLQDEELVEDGTFESLVKEVERRLWEERFTVYADWKEQWYADYRERTWFKTLSGFICQGFMSRNDATNYPIQGSSFHCLLWCLIEIARKIKSRGMRSTIINQIHDSIVFDAVPEEVDDLVHLAFGIITKRLSEHFPWIAEVPMTAEAETAPVDAPWFYKRKIECPV
jgi:DNA polymerase I-like protein with 3'-5' exonuclease and polymerase domains